MNETIEWFAEIWLSIQDNLRLVYLFLKKLKQKIYINLNIIHHFSITL